MAQEGLGDPGRPGRGLEWEEAPGGLCPAQVRHYAPPATSV